MIKISDEAYEELKFILEKQYAQKLTPEDVKEVGDGLIEFYTLLEMLMNDTPPNSV